MQSSISVCIPTYHRPKFLQEALYSVFAQTLQPIEIVIGDDSHDNITENLVLDIKNKCKIPISWIKLWKNSSKSKDQYSLAILNCSILI